MAMSLMLSDSPPTPAPLYHELLRRPWRQISRNLGSEKSSVRLRGYRRSSALSHGALRQHCQHGRKFHTKNRAAGLAVIAEDLSAMFLHDAITNAETQTSAFSHRFRGVERIEHPMRFAEPGAVSENKST